MTELPVVRPVTVTTDGLTLSGLAADPVGTPARGLILALHGGGYCAGYWDNPANGGALSLLRLAASLGFHGLALDRPGYGASAGCDPAHHAFAAQARILADAAGTWRTQAGHDDPVFVIGHSIGGMLALHIAARQARPWLRGIEALGVPLRFPDSGAVDDIKAWDTADIHIPPLPDAQHRPMLFGPDGTFSEEALAYDRTLARPMPAIEYRDAMSTPPHWPAILGAIRIPVQLTLAAHETFQIVTQEVADEARSRLHASPLVRILFQPDSGHNASSHHIGRAYHLRALAFFEECLAHAAAHPSA